MELFRTTLIPIIRLRTKAIAGGYSLGRFTGFDGTETTFTLPSGKIINVVKWTPTSANQTSVKGGIGTTRAKWFIACTIDEPTYNQQFHKGYAEYIPMEQLLDNTRFVAGGGIQRIDVTPGTLLNSMAPSATVNQPPICNADPLVAGSTASGGTATVTTGTWAGAAPTFAYQWMLETGVSAGTFAAVGGATANSWVITASNTGKKLYCAVTATDVDGSRTQSSNQVTLT